MEPQILIRAASAADAPHIADFNLCIARETEDLELNPEIVAAGVSRLIAQPEFGFYVVAELGGSVVGSMMVTYEWSDWRNGLYWWIQSVFVKPDCRRLGIYKKLHQHVREMARADANARGLRLYVELENITAQNAYLKMGMQPAGYKIFEELF